MHYKYKIGIAKGKYNLAENVQQTVYQAFNSAEKFYFVDRKKAARKLFNI